jgi:hypothetical protein
VRVGADVHPLARPERDRAEVIEEDERPDALTLPRRQHAPHLEAAEIARAPLDSQRDRVDGAVARVHGCPDPPPTS